MPNYGTIPVSDSSPEASNRLRFISTAKDRLKSGLATRRSWRQMVPDLHHLSLPSGFSAALSRIKSNLAYFRVNYAIVFLLIVFLSLIWHPVSMIVFIVMLAVWVFLYFLRDEPLVILHRTINDRVVLSVLSVVTIVALLLTHATANILIALLVGLVVVVIHAAARTTEDLGVDEEALGKRPLNEPIG